MSPTVFHYKHYRFFFFSREEPRRQVHVRSPDGEAKFWLEPDVELAKHHGLSQQSLGELEVIVKEQSNEICKHWDNHFRT
jgi:hypothetical protein